MSDSNGSPDFTHDLGTFKLEGHEFRRRKIRPRDWAETMARLGTQERAEMEKTEGSVLFAVSGDGLYELVLLAVRDEDKPTFTKLYEDGLIEFGELSALRDWLWEQMTARPFKSDTPSSAGPGNDSEASSKDESSSEAEVLRG